VPTSLRCLSNPDVIGVCANGPDQGRLLAAVAATLSPRGAVAPAPTTFGLRPERPNCSGGGSDGTTITADVRQKNPIVTTTVLRATRREPIRPYVRRCVFLRYVSGVGYGGRQRRVWRGQRDQASMKAGWTNRPQHRGQRRVYPKAPPTTSGPGQIDKPENEKVIWLEKYCHFDRVCRPRWTRRS